METPQIAILGGFLVVMGLVFLRLVAIGRHAALQRRKAEVAEKSRLEAGGHLLEQANQAAQVRQMNDVELVDPIKTRR